MFNMLVISVYHVCICIYMWLSFDVGIIYLLNVNKCMHIVNGGTHNNFILF